ncbi:hypothetical protein MMC24_000675 [Lignoscripta atroalba]|nr:hypothetical protein [Lignoscripta atroalba]
MALLRFAIISWIFGQFCVGAPQEPTPLPSALAQLSGITSAAPSCGGCYVVADVAAIVFGAQALTNIAATELVSVGVGLNGSRYTSISVIANEGQFTIDPSGLVTGVFEATVVNFGGPTILVNGATLTSPTAYNVFSAYTVTVERLVNGRCVTSAAAASTVSPAVEIPIPPDADQAAFGLVAEQSFISRIGRPTCIGVGAAESIRSTVQIIVENATVTSATTGLIRPRPAAATLAESSSPTAAISASPSQSPSASSPTSTVSSIPSSSPISSSPSSLSSSIPLTISSTSSPSSAPSSLSSTTPPSIESSTSGSQSTSSPTASPSQTLPLAPGVILPATGNLTTTPTRTVVIITNSTTTAAEIIFGSSTSTISAGSEIGTISGALTISVGPDATVTLGYGEPFLGQGANWKHEPGAFWVAWAMGVLSWAFVAWVL